MKLVEVFIAAGVFLLLLFVARGAALAHWSLLMSAGGIAAVLGLALGIVAGIGYHAALYRALAPLGKLRTGWLWRPTGYHALLTPAQRRAVMPWFYAGVTTMFMALSGCALILAGILIM
jgi:hypothetical protein